jgi:transcriptional regulator with XRE-family HTH domain
MTGAGGEWHAVAAFLREQRKLAQLSLRHLARLTNVSDSYLSQVERGLYQPSPDVLKAMGRALGIPPAVLYERMGWLDDDALLEAREDAGGVEAAIERDVRLNPEQKAALRAMYRALAGPPDPAA